MAVSLTALSKLKQNVHTLDAEEGEMFPECSTALATFGHWVPLTSIDPK